MDRDGAAYVRGVTLSSDYPVTPGAFDCTPNGDWDVFVAKISSNGSDMVYGTFLGGSSAESGSGIAVDGSGAAYITGWTRSSDFPTTLGAFDITYNGDEVFVVKLTPNGNDLVYSTFLGGSSGDYGKSIAVDTNGIAYITGSTRSSDFPAMPGAFDTNYNGDYDAFVVKLDVGTISGAIPSGLLTLLSAETISPFRPLVITAQVDNAGLAQQEFDLAFHLWHDNNLVDTQFFILPVNSGATAAQAANFGLRTIGRYRVEAVLAAKGATLATQSRDIIVVDAYAARIILDYAGDLQAAAHAELDDIAYVPSYALSDEIVSLGLDKLQDYAIGKFADLAAPIQEAGDLPLSTSDGAIAEIRDKLGRVRQYRRNLASAIRLYVSDLYDVTLPDGFDPLNPDLDSITDPILKDRIKNWLNEYIAVFLSDNIVSPLWVNGPHNDVDDRHLAFEDFLLSHPVAAEPQGLAGQMQRGRDRILNVVEGDALITLGPYDVLGQTLQYDLTLQEQENKRQQIHTFDDILKIIIPVLVIIGVVIIVLLIIGAISSSGVLAAVVGPIIWKIVKILHAISKIVPMATALLAVSMLFTASIVAPHVPQYHDETLDAAEMLIGSSGLAWLHNFDVAVRLGQAQLTVQVDGPEVGESQVPG